MGDAFAPWHIIILVVVFMVLFGARKLPGAAQSLGQAMRIFKAETKGLVHDDDKDAPPVAATPTVNTVTAAPQFVAAPQPAQQPQYVAAQQPQPSQQEQIEALQRQLNDLQAKPAGGVAANGAPLSEAQPNQPG